MAAHRYWRATAFEAYAGGGLELSEFHLLAAGSRVDAGATLSSNVVPAAGTVESLSDDVLSTAARWSAAHAPLLMLTWDFGAGGAADVDDIRLAGDSREAFPHFVTTQYSDDGATWTQAISYDGIAWPGLRSKSVSEPVGGWFRSIRRGAVSISSDGAVATYVPTSTISARPIAQPKNTGVLQAEFTQQGPDISGSSVFVGVAAAPPHDFMGSDTTGWGYGNNGTKRLSGNSGTTYGATWVVGDVIGVVVNFLAGSISFYKNGVSQGVAFTGLDVHGPLFPAVAVLNYGPAYQTQLVTKDFVFPIAGAAPWEPRSTAIARSRVGGRSTPVVSATVATAAGAVNATARMLEREKARPDFINILEPSRGIGRLKGTTKDKATPSNIPVSERVRLHRMSDGMLMREVWSAPGTGAYSFDFIDELQTYYVVSFDHEGNFRAVVADGLNLANGGVELIA